MVHGGALHADGLLVVGRGRGAVSAHLELTILTQFEASGTDPLVTKMAPAGEWPIREEARDAVRFGERQSRIMVGDLAHIVVSCVPSALEQLVQCLLENFPHLFRLLLRHLNR